jgi:phage terminase small subunit
MSLTRKQRVFIAEYLQCWNATEAARRAGYAHPRQQGSRLLSNVDIQEEYELRLAEIHVSADEALAIIGEQARGDLGDFMDIHQMGFNLQLLNDDGTRKNTRIIKKIKQKTTTFIAKNESDEDREVHELEIELYDAQAANDKILRVHGKYKDSLDVTPIKVIVEYADGKASSAPPPSGAGQSEE